MQKYEKKLNSQTFHKNTAVASRRQNRPRNATAPDISQSDFLLNSYQKPIKFY